MMVAASQRAIHAYLTFIDGLVKVEMIDRFQYNVVIKELEIEMTRHGDGSGWGDEKLDAAADGVLQAMHTYLVALRDHFREEVNV